MSSTRAKSAKQLKRAKKALKARERRKARWYNARRNTNLYVSGLPRDATPAELCAFLGRAGVIRAEVASGEPRVKVYRDEAGAPKGDALVSYANRESVGLALQVLQGGELRAGYPLRLEEATFEQKGEYLPRRATAVDPLAKLRLRATREKLFGWRAEAEEGPRIVILRNLFTPDDYDEASREAFFELLEADVAPELQKFGAVKRLSVYRENPQGVVEVRFAKPDSASQCITAMHGRYYNGRRVECFYHDGRTNYRAVEEDAAETLRRIEDFGAWLGGQIDANRF